MQDCVEDAGHREVGMVHTAEHQDGAVRQSQIEQIPWPHDNLDDAFVLVTENDSGLVKNARGLDAGLTLIGERWDDEPNGVLNVELGETEAGQSGCVDRTEGHNSGECMGGGSLGGRQVVPEAIAGCNDALDIKSGGDRVEGHDDGECVGDVSLGESQAVPDARTGGHVAPDNQGGGGVDMVGNDMSDGGHDAGLTGGTQDHRLGVGGHEFGQGVGMDGTVRWKAGFTCFKVLMITDKQGAGQAEAAGMRAGEHKDGLEGDVGVVDQVGNIERAWRHAEWSAREEGGQGGGQVVTNDAVEMEQKIEVKHELKGQMGDVFLTL